MLIDIVFPRLPPHIDGIGDHTYQLATELASRGHEVRILTQNPNAETVAALLSIGLEVLESWPTGNLRSTDTLILQITKRQPDWVILQFEQFSYGTRGFNPAISRLFRRAQRRAPSTQFLLYAHETYTKPSTLRKAVLSLFQRRQFQNLTGSASQIAITTDAWRNSRDFRGVQPLTVPVFSNIPLVAGESRESLRNRHGIPLNEPIVINFGNHDASRAAYLRAAAVAMSGQPYTFAYLGKDTEAVRLLLSGIQNVRVVTLDRPTGSEVSQYLSCADMSLAPFVDGVTTRRGSFLAALQHGLPTVTTISNAESLLDEAHRMGIFAASHPGDATEYGRVANALLANTGKREAMSALASEYYESNFALRTAVDNLILTMTGVEFDSCPAPCTTRREH